MTDAELEKIEARQVVVGGTFVDSDGEVCTVTKAGVVPELIAEVRRLRSLVERLADYPWTYDNEGSTQCRWCWKLWNEDESHEPDCVWLEARNEQAVKP